MTNRQEIKNEHENSVKKIIDEFIPESGASILEIMCGSGAFSSFLGKKNNEVIGVDTDADKIIEARELSNDRLDFVCSDYLELPFDTEQFDISVCFENFLGNSLSDCVSILEELIMVTSEQLIFYLDSEKDSKKIFEGVLEKVSDDYTSRIAEIEYIACSESNRQFFAIIHLEEQ
jgi:ubiquinone/menaquinone biosynthesis C-methylase UbiE